MTAAVTMKELLLDKGEDDSSTSSGLIMPVIVKVGRVRRRQ